ncbi:MAG: ABC transporter substrate-binding protein [Chloroflexi bacterium]|nr:ABC transporter substrate-binding protein [Chloroflexota bacterium]
MVSSKRFRFVAVMLALLVMVTPAYANFSNTGKSAQFQSDATQVVVPAGEPIKIGLATDLSNVIPQPGQDIANGGRIAVLERNEAGGIQGFQVELDVQDDRCSGEDATNVANLFASDPQIAAVVGHVCSGATSAAIDVYVQARIPSVSPSSTAAFLPEKGYDTFNRVAFSDAAQGTVDARYIYTVLGITTLAVVHDNSDYGKGLAETVAAAFTELGGTVANGGELLVINPDEQDYRAVLTPLAAEAPGAVFFGGYESQAALLVSQMKEVGLADTAFMSDDGTFTQGYIDAAGEAANGSYASFVDTSSFANAEALDAFTTRYEAEFGVSPDELGPYHAHAYDAASIIMNAIDAVATVDADGNLVINREELITAIRNTKDYAGLTGTLTCDPATGECGAGLISMNLVEDGAWTAVEVPADLQYGAEAAGGEETSMGGDYATVVDAIAAQPNLTTLASVFPMAGADVSAALTGAGPFTIFAPTDDAFNTFMAANADLVNQALADPTILANLLSYHVVPGNLLAADVAGSTELTTLTGQTITVTVDGDSVVLNGTVKLVTTDIVAGNGVVHIIDAVLLSPAE